MRLQPLTESVIDLNFMPMEDFINLPCLVASNCRFAGFNEMDKALYLDEPLEKALFIYKKLTLPELARLYLKISERKTSQQKVADQPIAFNWEFFLNHYNIKWSQDLEQLFQILPKTKLSFQNWVSQKDCGLSELQILTWANTQYPFYQIDKLLNFIAKINPSRQIGTKILEYTLEKLDEIDMDSFTALESAEKAYEYIYRNRFPETSQKDQDFKNILLKTPWPAHIRATAQRQGDRSGVEIKFFAGSFEEYEKRVDGLHQIKETVKRNLWNKS